MTKFLVSLVAFCLFGSLPSCAQTVSAVPTNIQHFRLPTDINPSVVSIQIDRAMSVAFFFPSSKKDHAVYLKDPSGRLLNPFDVNQQVVQAFISPDPQISPSESLYVYNFTIDNPAPGAWELRIDNAVASASVSGSYLQMLIHNPVAAYMTIAPLVIKTNGQATTALVVVDGTSKLTNVQITATLVKTGDPYFSPQSVQFADDGVGVDGTAGDGTYSAALHLVNPGSYYVLAEITGTASTGQFRRTAGSPIKVLPPPAVLTGNVTQRLEISYPEPSK